MAVNRDRFGDLVADIVLTVCDVESKKRRSGDFELLDLGEIPSGGYDFVAAGND